MKVKEFTAKNLAAVAGEGLIKIDAQLLCANGYGSAMLLRVTSAQNTIWEYSGSKLLVVLSETIKEIKQPFASKLN